MPITADLVSASPEVRSNQLKCLPVSISKHACAHHGALPPHRCAPISSSASLPPSPSMHVLTTAPSPPHRCASAVCSRATSSSSRAMGFGMSSRARRPSSTCIRTGPPKVRSERSRCSCRRRTSSSTRSITSLPATCDSAPRSDEARRRRFPSPRPTQPTGCGRAPKSRYSETHLTIPDTVLRDGVASSSVLAASKTPQMNHCFVVKCEKSNLCPSSTPRKNHFRLTLSTPRSRKPAHNDNHVDPYGR